MSYALKKELVTRVTLLLLDFRLESCVVEGVLRKVQTVWTLKYSSPGVTRIAPLCDCWILLLLLLLFLLLLLLLLLPLNICLTRSLASELAPCWIEQPRQQPAAPRWATAAA